MIAGGVAVAAIDPDSPDAGVAAHYGDPLREQRTMIESVGLVDRSHRGVVAVPGEERLSWLHNITTQHLADLPAGQGTETLVLSPHGHVEHHALVAEDGSATWLDTEPGAAPPLLEFLEKMRFLTRVEPRDASSERAMLSLVGPELDDALAALGLEPLRAPDLLPVPGPKFATGAVLPRPTGRYEVSPLPERLGRGHSAEISAGSSTGSRRAALPRAGDGKGAAEREAGPLAPGQRGGGDSGRFQRRAGADGPGVGGFARRGRLGVDLSVPRERLDDVVGTLTAAGVPTCGIWAYEALRVAARIARVGLDTDHRTLPMEVDLVAPGVHLEKGCYRGQETVARVHHLGRPPRRLVLLQLDGSGSDQLPTPGTPVNAGERAVGFLGTAAHHAELGPIALAVLRRNVADDAALQVAGTAAAIDPTPTGRS